MASLLGYTVTESINSNDEFELFRAYQEGQNGHVLILSTVSERPAPSTIALMEHEYELRSQMPAQASVIPIAFERSGTKAYLIMKDPGGEIADKFMASKADASLEIFLKIAVNIAEALGEIHAEGFIHGNIRPGNFLVNLDDCNVSIMGFGIATKEKGIVESLESQNIPLKLMAYLSPEKTGRMNRAVDSRSDLYSLGITLYQLLTRKLPFDAENMMEWVHCHVARTPVPVTEQKSDVPPVVEAIILKLLEKNAEDRYQTAQGLAFDLKNCLTQWVEKQSIDSFGLASHDHSGQLRIIDKVYGRIEEKKQIHQLLDKVIHGAGEALVLRGPSGMGKTTLATEVLSTLDTSKANIISVKFESSESHVPYTFVVHSVKEFVRQTLFKSEDTVLYWKNKICSALQENAKIAIDIVPELEMLIGSQPDVIPLPVSEAKKRFQSTLMKFYNALCDQQRPLILFLDDFDSIDTASLELLQQFSVAGYKSCLIIYAFKNNDVTNGNAIDAFADKLLTLQSINVGSLMLGPLDRQDIIDLTSDTLNESPDRLQEFTAAVYEKTGGSPFFSVQFLESCVEERTLWFDIKKGNWCWDLPAINAKTFSDNVVEVLLNKIEKLSDKTKYILQVFSCAGSSIKENLLAMLCDTTRDELNADLQEALQAGFVVHADDQFMFTHERIKASAYQMMSDIEQNQTHLNVARLFKQTIAEADTAGSIFSIVFQWNKAINLVKDEAEKSYVRLLNKMAGVKAKASTAYQAARDYFFLVNLLTTEQTWLDEYDNTLFSYLELLECEFLLGQHEKADEWSNIILGYAQSEIDKSKVYEMRMRVYQLTGKLEDAIKAGLMGLQLFNYYFPESEEELAQLVAQEKAAIDQRMQGREISSLVELPQCNDPEIETVISLMTDLGPCLAIVRPKSFLYVLQVMKSVSLSLDHGFTPKSCFMLQNYARRLITHGKDVKSASAFANVALDIYAGFDDRKMKGTILFFDAVYLNHWQERVERSFAKFENAFNACTAIGNFGFASFSAYFLVTHIMDQGQSLEKVYEAATPYLEFAQKIHNTVLYEAILLYQQHISGLQLEASELMHPDCAKMSEADRFEWLKNAKFAPGIGGYMILKQRTSMMYRQYAASVGIGRVVGANVAPGGLAAASYNFVQAISLINLQKHGQEKPYATIEALKEELAPFIAELKFMAECCSENFQDRYELVQAELASLEGRFQDAEKHYEAAILNAHANGFSINEALAYELAGVYYREQGKITISNAYLFKAMETFKHIGATAKVKQMSKLYPGLKEEFGGKGMSAANTGNLDVMSIISASQAMSSEIVLDQVIKYLMTIVLENAGAVRGLLILPFEEGYKIAAEAKTGKEISVNLQHSDITSGALPESIYQYVIRSKKNLLLDNAFDSKEYTADPYVQKNRAKSLLFLPLIKQGKMTGILYLENNLSTGAFTTERMTVLEMLISQASISIENARLYKQQQEAEAEIRRHRDHLEELVGERTIEIKQKTNDIESMLKNMDLGICTIVPGNKIHHEYSPYLEVIFSENQLAGRDFMQSIFSKTDLGADALDQVSVGLSAIIDSDVMMYDFNSHLLIDEMTITHDDLQRTIQIDWSPIVNEDDIVEKMLFISKDVTHLKELEADFAQQRQNLTMISQIIKVDAVKFDHFIAASLEYVVKNRDIIVNAQLNSQESIEFVTVLFRNMHTIKGNSRTYNFGLVTEAAHQAEQYYDAIRHQQTQACNFDQMLYELDAVETALRRYDSVNRNDLGRGQQEKSGQSVDGVVVNHDLLAQLQQLMALETEKGNTAFTSIQAQLNALKLVPIEKMVSEVSQALASTAAEMGKPLPNMQFTDKNLGFDPGIQSVFQDSLMHLLRNALDHGIEKPAERIAKGKPAAGCVTFEPEFRADGTVTLYISDDGRGLALHKLYEKGLEAGIFNEQQMPSLNEIAEIIFNSGLSTAETVSDVSGRGVGMDAVRVFLQDIGATVQVDFGHVTQPTSPQQLDFLDFKFAIDFKLSNLRRTSI